MGSSNSKSFLKFRFQKGSLKRNSKLEYCDSFNTIDLEAGQRKRPYYNETFELTDLDDGVSANVETKFNDGIQNVTVKNCIDLSHAIEIIRNLTHDLSNSDILMLKIEVKKEEEEKLTKFNEIAQDYKHIAVIVLLTLNESKKYEIFWKTKNFDNFLTISPVNELNSGDNLRLFCFVKKLLVVSLKNQHNGLHSDCVINSDTKIVDLHLLADENDHNLLQIATKEGNLEMVKILLNLDIKVHLLNTSIKAQDLALENCHYDVLLEMIHANLPYPSSIDINSCSWQLKKFYKTVKKFHAAVKSDNIKKMKKILDKFPNQKYFYNSSNESALKISILNSSTTAYEFLKSRKLQFGPHEDPEDLYQHLSYAKKRKVRDIHIKFTKPPPEKHLNILMMNSSVFNDEDDVDDKIKYIKKAYKTLNSNQYVKIILKIVAASKNFKIIFDFDRESVNIADPTVDSYTQGLFYPTGNIYIGAKQLLDEATENLTLANLAHEFCHFAMDLVYKNNAKPYKSNDSQTLREFEKISEKCKENSEKDEIIEMVYECYSPKMHHAELIVRVVHMLMHYVNDPETLDKNRKIFKPLFEFYKNKIFPELQTALPELENHEERKLQEKKRKIIRYRIYTLVIFIIILCVAVAYLLYTPAYKFKKLSETDRLNILAYLNSTDYKREEKIKNLILVG